MTCEQLFGLFPDPCVYVLTSAVGDAALAFISEREAASIVDAVPKRRREFATARGLAREGLERFFDLHDFDLLNDNVDVFGLLAELAHESVRDVPDKVSFLLPSGSLGYLDVYVWHGLSSSTIVLLRAARTGSCTQ